MLEAATNGACLFVKHSIFADVDAEENRCLLARSSLFLVVFPKAIRRFFLFARCLTRRQRCVSRYPATRKSHPRIASTLCHALCFRPWTMDRSSRTEYREMTRVSCHRCCLSLKIVVGLAGLFANFSTFFFHLFSVDELTITMYPWLLVTNLFT